jgi:hypothetical protein
VLYLVLTLVIAAFGLLIAALTTANTVWAWVSVGISVFAAVLLVFDWARGRRRVAATSAPREVRRGGEVEETGPPAPEAAEVTSELAQAVEPVVEQPVAEEPEPVDDAEPGEESTDATDLLIVSDLGAEVRVVDEHPRYHLAKCSWLSNKSTIPLPVSEARSLGFTPCARCGPDATLAAQHRASKGAKQ